MMTLRGSLRLRVPARPVRRRVSSSRARRARLALGSTVVGLAAILAVGNALVDAYRVDAVDREYARRLELLREREAEHPGRPLLLVVGSSRMVMGFAPEQLPPLHDASGAEVLPFNFSHFGAGPVYTRIVAGRLVREGVRPRAVVVEVMPAFFPRENARFVSGQATFRDVLDCGRYQPFGEMRFEWFRNRTAGFAGYAQRATRPPTEVVSYDRLGGYTKLKGSVTPEESEREQAVQAAHFARFMRDWRAPPKADRSFRDTIALFRETGAAVHIVLSPEGPDHRKHYGPGSEDRIAEYARAVGADTGVPVTDARRWLGPEDFTDGHHALRSGAAKFTARLADEVLRPMLTR